MIASYAYCSKQIEFGVMAPSEMVQASEVQVYERTLYKVLPQLQCLSFLSSCSQELAVLGMC